MKKFAALSIVLTAGLVWGAENIAIVKSVKGDVQVRHSGIDKPIVQGDFLQEGDLIRTSESGTVGMTFNDGTVISLGPKSHFVVNQYRFKPASKEYAFDMTLTKGSSAFESGKIGKLAPQKVRFNVPQGSVGIRGTKFIVDVEE